MKLRSLQFAKKIFASGLLSTMLMVPQSLTPNEGTADEGTSQALEEEVCAWADTSKSAEERATLLLDASSQHQKYRWMNEQAANTPTQTTFSGVVYPEQLPCTPLVIYANGAEGVHSTPGTTAWPAPIAVAATWNLELGELKGAMHASETFDSRKAVVLGPGLASGRTPLSGRTSEYFGEDALLGGLMAAANVRGLENGNPDKPVVANLKHYIANEQEIDRQKSSSNMSERVFRQVYDLPYEIAIAESDPGSVMCSYNQINGVYTCEDPILNTSLRDKMGFDGYVMSDFGSVHSTAESLAAGMDQELNRPIWYTPEKLDAALAAGQITQVQIDTAAFNVVKTYIEKGLFDNPVPDVAVSNVSTDQHKAVALKLAEQSAVLLKNEDVLPLTNAIKSVAVIGQTASVEETDGVSAKSVCSASFRGRGVLDCSSVIDPLTAITNQVENAGGRVFYDSGSDPRSAAIAAATADVAIVFGHITMGEFDDIADINLDGNGDELVQAVADAAGMTVVVVNSGTAVEMPWIDSADAVITGWYAGEQQGPALANLLFGKTNFSGKLPMTFPKSIADTPTNTPEQYPGVFSDGSTVRTNPDEIRQVNYSEGLEVGYRWYQNQEIEPLFEFGHGLSYTTFDYSDVQLSKAAFGIGERVQTTVSVKVTNTGTVRGTEIPQVYLEFPQDADEPGKRLVGFGRIELAPGESKVVSVPLDSSSVAQPFSIWDETDSDWKITPGAYYVHVGSSSEEFVAAKRLTVGEVAQELEIGLAVTPSTPDGAADWYVNAVNFEITGGEEADGLDYSVTVNGTETETVGNSFIVSTQGEVAVVVRAQTGTGVQSNEAKWTGKLDLGSPAVNANVDAKQGLLTLSATDEVSGVASIEYQAVEGTEEVIDETKWLTYSNPVKLENDSATIAFRALDNAGNVSEVSFEIIQVDGTPTPKPTESGESKDKDTEKEKTEDETKETQDQNPGNQDKGLAATGFTNTGLAILALMLITLGGLGISRRLGKRSAL
ncbi:glycoside hydrolase family 3 C-terminal domain-containing protein [Jonesiaceae bacterium BS-20]|uniref:Glycoside hydrolase family 3 C-terminal domain-containing protein n=1 Tax=Jonesiaceae bacterium BS-20 TaxID=3120821 RepID=A0AAU7DUG2_9MICO